MAAKATQHKEVDTLQKMRGFWFNYSKPVMYIGSAVIIILVGWLVYKYMFKAPKEEKKMGERRVVVDKAYLYDEDKPLTVCKTSLFHTGDGFTAYDCNGDIIFRVDSYGRDNDELVLMDATGKCLLTVKRKVKNHLINYYKIIILS